MPRLDGTGPQSQGPMTGRGEGYCAIKIPEPGEVPQGYAGLQGVPVRLGDGLADGSKRSEVVVYLENSR